MTTTEANPLRKRKYIVCDCETGGADPRFSLLTAHFSHLDDNLEVMSSLDLKFRPDYELFVVNPSALACNGIDLTDHAKYGISYTDGYQELSDFEQLDPKRKECQSDRQHGDYEEEYDESFTLVGWNIGFDVEFIKKHIFEDCITLYDDFFSYTSFDVKSVAINLQNLGYLPADLKLSLSNLANHFNIDAAKAHNAKEDCILTLKVLKRLNSLIQTKN